MLSTIFIKLSPRYLITFRRNTIVHHDDDIHNKISCKLVKCSLLAAIKNVYVIYKDFSCVILQLAVIVSESENIT